MERCHQEEPVEYGVLMPSPQITQQATSIGTSPNVTLITATLVSALMVLWSMIAGTCMSSLTVLWSMIAGTCMPSLMVLWSMIAGTCLSSLMVIWSMIAGICMPSLMVLWSMIAGTLCPVWRCYDPWLQVLVCPVWQCYDPWLQVLYAQFDSAMIHDCRYSMPSLTVLWSMIAGTCMPSLMVLWSMIAGTFVSGLTVLCCSKIRPGGGDKMNVVWVNTWVGLLQFLTAFLFLLGWIWSIMWGASFLSISGECIIVKTVWRNRWLIIWRWHCPFVMALWTTH